MSSIVNLSPLTSGSRQVCFSLLEGVPYELDSSFVCSTASYTDVGVSTRLRLVAYAENQAVKAAGGCSFIKAAAVSSGNNALIPLPHSEAERMDLFKGEFSDGTTAVTVSSSRQAEKVLFSYDPVSYAASTATSSQSPFIMTFTEVASVSDFGGLAWASSAEVLRSDLVITRETSSSNFFVCVRTNTQLADDVFSPAQSDAAGAASFGSKAVRFCAEPPTPGLGWTLFEAQRNELFLAADVHLNSADAPIPFSIDASVAAVGSELSDSWIAFELSALSTTGKSGNLLEVFFGTLTPVVGSRALIHPLRTVARISPPGHRRVIRTVWNAEQVFGSNRNPYGGTETY